jgi:hypothetical protein
VGGGNAADQNKMCPQGTTKQNTMNYLCLVDGVVEYGSTDLNHFNHYRMVYAEDHQDVNVEYLVLTDEEYEAMFPVEDE